MKHIRIISPSGAIDSSYIQDAVARLSGWGYRVTEGRYARGRKGRFSGTDEERLADIVDALQDPDIDYVLCSRGGYGLQRIIDCVLSECPANKGQALPKIIGFSDITELHQWSLLNSRESLHGLMCKHLSQLPEDSEMIIHWRNAVEGKTLHYNIPAHSLNRNGNVEGTLIGGNLSVLYGLQATPLGLLELPCFCNDKAKPILFIEDIAERHYHIDRMMNNLKMSGVLAQLGGLIVGQFADCEDDESMGETIYETVRRAVEEYGYPVLFDFPAGHVERNLPLWLGKKTSLTVSNECGIVEQ
ncbi:MAG: LD-carboxypeptidase [Paludibacteraceae bacterium]|nr:LD-carboxypeptidase [Paludibacteraceae bacterium]